MNARAHLLVVSGLALALLVCLLGIIWLASANPARSIPDVLVAVPTGILGILGGMLVPRPGDTPR
jgi:hypothetical protein